ncbi:MAG: hypothetical protein RQ763_08615 [Sulfurimonas sp.]|uniref:hypothetical protein n=1 Tax=Sulfurimonas sp. TaxID=2022749 RepID=UPI0028CCDDB4|nr:hypothetical protein [Sulfurimonas sp.]MDT8339248.1 hypothetical protein [Sulfurimonas sp.]
MKNTLKMSVVAVGAAVMFSGCSTLSDMGSAAYDIESIMSTSSMVTGMFQSTEVDGAKSKEFSKEKMASYEALAIQFKGNDSAYWGGHGLAFDENIETELMKKGFSTYKYSSTSSSANYEGKPEAIADAAKKLKAKGVDALITGTITSSHEVSSGFAGAKSKATITAANFSIVDVKTGKTMATVNIAYKNGVSNIECAKDISLALTGMMENPDMEIAKAFEQAKAKKS